MMERFDSKMRVLYIPQELDADRIDRLLHHMRALSDQNLGRVMSLMSYRAVQPICSRALVQSA